MKKQIEEMAKIMCRCCSNKCDDTSGCIVEDYAEAIYNKDYRKRSDTAKEIFAEIGKILTAKYNSIQAGCHHRMRFGNADTPQGMKELGELSGVRQVIAEIKAFEKKYLEDDNDS